MVALQLVSPILVLGPAYSGKSQWARGHLENHRATTNTLIIQTGPKSNPQPRLPESPQSSWEYQESGLDLTGILIERIKPHSHVLVDSINQWIGRLVSEEGPKGKTHVVTVIQEFLLQLKTKWETLPHPKPLLILLSAEVGASPPPDQDHERFFRQNVGITNQALAQWAQTVVTIQAGLPLVLKSPL